MADPVSSWGAPGAMREIAPRSIDSGYHMDTAQLASNPSDTSTNPFATNFSGVQPGTGKGTGYQAVNVDHGQAVNPWADQMGKDMPAMAQGTQQAQQNLQTLDSQKSNYPAMNNAYGLGAPVGQDSDPSSANSYAAKPITSQGGSSSDGGINPWSLQGEATARNSW